MKMHSHPKGNSKALTQPHIHFFNMQLATALFSVLTALTLTFDSANAANLCTYTSRGCSGSYACCNNVPANNCCWWSSSSYGWSVRYSSMSGSWGGATYGNTNCSTEATPISVTGSTVCKSKPPSLPDEQNFNSTR